MAYIEIHQVCVSSDYVIKYCTSDKTGIMKDDISDSINYIVDNKTGDIVYKTLSTYFNCGAGSAIEEFNKYIDDGLSNTRRPPQTKSGKEVVIWHLIQSFNGHECSPETANEIGYKFAKEIFKRFPCIISTHTNTDNIHNHIEICAWNLDGKKWNNDNTNYRNMRKISDKLCAEYGLSVIEHTKDYKLVGYKDKNNKMHYYEPTERKNKIIQDRNAENIKGRINDYRNSQQYAANVLDIKTNRGIIKGDIDSLLSVVSNYEELLYRLRDIGYKIKDKDIEGEWRKHITFVPPYANKGTRDSAIGDGIFYQRDNLTKYINETVLNRERGKGQDLRGNEAPDTDVNAVKFIPVYRYGEFNISDLNPKFRVKYNEDGEQTLVRRNVLETVNVNKIIKTEQEIIDRYIDTGILEKMAADRNPGSKRKKKPYDKYETELLQRMQDELKSLSFIEKYNILSVEHACTMYKSLNDNYKRCVSDLNKIDMIIESYKHILNSIDQTVLCSDTERHNEVLDSHITQLYDDNPLENNKENIELIKTRIDSTDDTEALREKLSGYALVSVRLRSKADEIFFKLEDVKNCIKVMGNVAAYDKIGLNNLAKNKNTSIARTGETPRSPQPNQANISTPQRGDR